MESIDVKKEDRLLHLCKSEIDNIPQLERSLRNGHTNERFISISSWRIFEIFALKSFFIDHDLNIAKQCFYKCGLLDVLLTEKYNDKMLNYGINRLSYTLLSDNKDLISRYANLSHTSFQQAVSNGTGAPMYALQCLIKQDYSELTRVMSILFEKTIPKFKMELDAQYFEAMAEKNKSKIEKVLESLLSPKMHKIRNKEQGLVGEFISHPALGYAKLAWIKGVEVEVNSPLVPLDLLRIEPLEEYKELDLFEMPAILS